MPDVHSIAASHVAAAMAECERSGIPADVLGRALLSQVVMLYKRTRTAQDIAHELEFAARNLEDDEEYTFMRP